MEHWTSTYMETGEEGQGAAGMMVKEVFLCGVEDNFPWGSCSTGFSNGFCYCSRILISGGMFFRTGHWPPSKDPGGFGDHFIC